jgi:hypothetical protein
VLFGNQEIENLLLATCHFASIRGLPVVKPMQMQECMYNVELHLSRQGRGKSSRVSPRRVYADEYFAVFKSDDVRRSCRIEKLLMQRRHPAVRDEKHRDFVQACQRRDLIPADTRALPQSAFTESLKTCHVYANGSLKIPDDDPGGISTGCATPHPPRLLLSALTELDISYHRDSVILRFNHEALKPAVSFPIENFE